MKARCELQCDRGEPCPCKTCRGGPQHTPSPYKAGGFPPPTRKDPSAGDDAGFTVVRAYHKNGSHFK